MLQLLSSNFRNTPIEAREKIFVGKDNYEKIHLLLTEGLSLEDVVIVSTCNRLEIYLLTPRPLTEKKREKVVSLLFEGLESEPDERVRFDAKSGDQALLHLFRVACSLESLIVGEPQILGQLKRSLETADSLCPISGTMRLFFEKAFSAAKRVKNETRIHEQAISISSTAVKLARSVFGGLAEKSLLVVGAGKMAELAVHAIAGEKNVNLLVANRTFQHAVDLAKNYNGSALSLDSLAKNLHLADIVISSTGTKNFMIDAKTVAKALIRRKYEPMFFIDIALPRDIDPKVNDLDNAYLYDLDDLKNISRENLNERKTEAEKANLIVKEERDALLKIIRIKSRAHLIRDFRENYVRQALREYFSRYRGVWKEHGDCLEENISRKKSANCPQCPIDCAGKAEFVRSWAGKLLHRPTLLLKKKIDEGDDYFLENFVNIFGVDLEERRESERASNIVWLKAE